jgi:hypothetical protein
MNNQLEDQIIDIFKNLSYNEKLKIKYKIDNIISNEEQNKTQNEIEKKEISNKDIFDGIQWF